MLHLHCRKKVAPAEGRLVATRFTAYFLPVRFPEGRILVFVCRVEHVPLGQNSVRLVGAMEVWFRLDAFRVAECEDDFP